MGLLADNNRKQKWSIDPRNQAWKSESQKEDGTNLGANLMRKMGWQEGQGLGKNGQGRLVNIKAKVKNNNLGIGCNVKDGKDWVAGQDDFNAVLRMLNDEDTSVFKEEKRKQKRAIQKKAMHAKFVKAKDLRSSSKADMKALFGSAGDDIFSKLKAETDASEKPKKDEAEEEEDARPSFGGSRPSFATETTAMDVEKSANLNTFKSATCQGNATDYFAKMMAKRGLANPFAAKKLDIKKFEEIVCKAEAEMENTENTGSKKKKKKSSKRKLEEEEIKEEPEETPVAKKKKKKKNSKIKEEAEEEIEAEPETQKKKKKQHKQQVQEEEEQQQEDVEEDKSRKKKKKKKSKTLS